MAHQINCGCRICKGKCPRKVTVPNYVPEGAYVPCDDCDAGKHQEIAIVLAQPLTEEEIQKFLNGN